MIVGFMRVGKRPSQLAELTAMLCHSQGHSLFYMRPVNVDIERNIVKGLIFDGNNWAEKEIEIPLLIDINPPCFRERHRIISNYLRENAYLTYDIKGALNKHLLLGELEQDSKFSHLVIPTIEADDFDKLLDFLEKHQSIVLKPINSDRGRGIYKLNKKEDSYILSYLTQDREIQRKELEDHFIKLIKNKGYICQKYISSRTKQGDPFDCRIHVQKNGRGKWTVARNYIRIGIGQKVISNVNQGGGISDLIPFLKANFGTKWEEINERINELAKTLPYKIEELKGTPTMSLGFDVAINEDGKLYLFESNGAPAVKPVLAKTSLLRVQYYQYIINNVIDKRRMKKADKTHSRLLKKLKHGTGYDEYRSVVLQRNKLKKQVVFAQQERDEYKKKYDEMMNSTSWKLSAPIRKIGSLKKNLKSKK